MKVERGRSVGSTGGTAKGGKSQGSSGFADSLRVGEEAPVAAVSSSPILTGIDAIFALQEVPDALAERKQALARGDQLLDRLDDLRQGLLVGRVSQDRMADLARLARESSAKVSDPKIREVLQEIELRAQVELAKLQQRDD